LGETPIILQHFLTPISPYYLATFGDHRMRRLAEKQNAALAAGGQMWRFHFSR